MKKKKMMKKMLSVSQKGGNPLGSICVALKMTREEFGGEIRKSKDLCRCFAMCVSDYADYWRKQLLCMGQTGKMYEGGGVLSRTKDPKMFKDFYINEVLKNVSICEKMIAEAKTYHG